MRDLNREELGFVYGACGRGRSGGCGCDGGSKSKKSKSHKSKSKKSKSKKSGSKHSRSRGRCW